MFLLELGETMKRLNVIDEAIEAGKKAFKRGMNCAVPPQYVGCDIQFAAWKLGWSQAATAKT